MPWIWTGRVATIVFALLAAARLSRPDPTLWVLVYLGAAATAATVARQRHVIRWVLVILIVFPIEMVAMSTPLGPWAQARSPYMAIDEAVYLPYLDAAGMALVAIWSSVLLLGRRFRVDGVI